MEDSEIKIRFDTLQKELSIVRTDLRELIPEVAEFKIYKDKIPQYSQRFEKIFDLMRDMDRSLVSNSTSIKIYFSILAILGPFIGAVIVKFVF